MDGVVEGKMDIRGERTCSGDIRCSTGLQLTKHILWEWGGVEKAGGVVGLVILLTDGFVFLLRGWWW